MAAAALSSRGIKVRTVTGQFERGDWALFAERPDFEERERDRRRADELQRLEGGEVRTLQGMITSGGMIRVLAGVYATDERKAGLTWNVDDFVADPDGWTSRENKHELAELEALEKDLRVEIAELRAESELDDGRWRGSRSVIPNLATIYAMWQGKRPFDYAPDDPDWEIRERKHRLTELDALEKDLQAEITELRAKREVDDGNDED